MNNLKITTRLAISIVFLLGALLFLTYAYFTAKQVEEQHLQRELEGMTFLMQVTKTTEALSHYRITLFRIRAGEAGFEEIAETQRQKANEELRVLGQYYASYAQLFALKPEQLTHRRRPEIVFAEINSLWESVSHSDYKNVPLENYNEIFRRMMRLSEYVAEMSRLIADDDMASYSLATAITLHVTEVIMRTTGTESDGYEAVVNQTPASHMDQLSSWDYGVFVRRDNLRLVRRGIENSDYYEIEETPDLKALDQQVREAMSRYYRYGSEYAAIRIELGEGKVVDHARYVTNGLGFSQAMFDLWYSGAKKLVYMLEARKDKACNAAYWTLAITLAAIAFAWGFFIYVTRGIVASLKDIEIAMDRVANGELDLEVPHLEQRDEIGSMARTLERFRNSYWWLKD